MYSEKSTPAAARSPKRSSLAPVPLHRGERIGPYRLCFEIAAGGMATVFLARVDLIAGLRRFVALKRIHPHLMSDTAFVEMFLDEARIASQVQHANVCSVFDFGLEDGAYYLAMEYLSGESLARVRSTLLRRPTPPEPERLSVLAARIVADAAEGIHAAHELCDSSGTPLDVVHRDVSPDNVFLTYDGVVKLIDFGIARASHQLHKTRTGVVKGKYAYMQPEVLHGRKPDRRADVWGLGVILWELLTLKRLFHRKTDMDTLRAVCELPIVPPSELRPGIPAALDDIVMRALSRDPDRRPATARALGQELVQFIADQGKGVGLADLSELMDELFAAGRAQKRQLMEIAERMDEAAETTPLPGEAEEASDDDPTACRSVSEPPTRPKIPLGERFARYRRHASGAALLASVAACLVAYVRPGIDSTAVAAADVSHTAKPEPVSDEPMEAPNVRPSEAEVAAEPVAARAPGQFSLGPGPYLLELVPPGEETEDGITLRVRPSAVARQTKPVPPNRPTKAKGSTAQRSVSYHNGPEMTLSAEALSP